MPLADCLFLQNAYQTGGTTVGSGTGTGTGTATGGTANPAPAPNPVVDPTTNSGQCYPSGWDVFNPVDWVLKPVECALSWAFVPSPATLTAVQTQISGDINTAGPGALIGAISGLIGSVNGGNGCAGPPVTFHIETVNDTFHPFDACTDPIATAAALVNDLATMLIIFYGGLSLMRAVSSGFGFSFGMRGK
jgi:hypothetical protein